MRQSRAFASCAFPVCSLRFKRPQAKTGPVPGSKPQQSFESSPKQRKASGNLASTRGSARPDATGSTPGVARTRSALARLQQPGSHTSRVVYRGAWSTPLTIRALSLSAADCNAWSTSMASGTPTQSGIRVVWKGQPVSDRQRSWLGKAYAAESAAVTQDPRGGVRSSGRAVSAGETVFVARAPASGEPNGHVAGSAPPAQDTAWAAAMAAAMAAATRIHPVVRLCSAVPIAPSSRET
jgi:hypothetical protein